MAGTMVEKLEDNGPVVVVDVGSGAVKLLIVDRPGLAVAAGVDAGSGGVHHTFGLKTRLLAGSSDRISDEALDATSDAFASFARTIKDLAPDAAARGRLRVIATAVARTTTNKAALDAMVRDAFDVEMEVLSGEREAELAFVGSTHGRQWTDETVVMDIGAGSTEFAFGVPGEPPVGALSLPVGGRTLVDSYLASDPARPEELSSALSVVELHVDDLRRELPDITAALESKVVVTGAMGAIAAVEIGVADPDERLDGEIITKPGIEELFRVLATESAADRIHNPGMRPEHVDDIVGAMCVLVEFMRQCNVGEVLVSERSVRYGLAVELLAER